MSDVLKPHPADRTSPFPLRPGRRCLAALGMVAAMAALLLVMGRDPTCPCGVVRLWQSGLDPLENSQQFADWYSLLHVVFGMALAAFAMAAALIYVQRALQPFLAGPLRWAALAALVGGGGLAYLVAAQLLGAFDVRELRGMVRRRR